MPVATPVAETMVPTLGVTLLHVPPGVALLNVVVADWQMARVPVMAAGRASTVTVAIARQPVGNV